MAAWGRRAVTGAAVGAVLYFAVEGGEWGTVALMRQRAHAAARADTVTRLGRTVDSLETYRKQVLTDPATQERIAREQFGYVKKGELVYKLVGPATRDSARPPAPRR
ncbi:MAG: septum formation initiator family protein [Gemmatimonadetes bacterium]|nr:septum formation initiator family protein [Gemmatimonadota bacterium]